MFFQRVKEILFLTPISTCAWFLMIALSAFIVFYFDLPYPWLMIPLGAYSLLILHEIIVLTTLGKGLFPSNEHVPRVYQWFNLFMDGCEKGEFEKIGDLTEGYFNGDYSKSIAQATLDKYELVIQTLNLKKGDRVLDVGCGLGDFLVFLKDKGIEGVGLTISPDHQRTCQSRGVNARVFDFRNELPTDLVGKFDAVTFFGCLEHLVQGYHRKNHQFAMRIWSTAFNSVYKALSPTSLIRKVFSTTLHRNVNYQWKLKDYLQGYLMQGHYSGFYPKEGDFMEACKPHFQIFHTYDASLDYQYSSIASPHHFGSFKVHWNLQKAIYCILLFIVNPFALMTWLYHVCHTWMWQFGGTEFMPESQRATKTIWYFYETT
jgi:cyclopropane fatty-acyl-phospholipid synthase-like methyltransferase